jgi:glycosyltransferase involved in cell wall biosynthesis
MTADPKLRILLSAYACGPGRVSEPGVGWNAVREISRDHDVWVLTSLDLRHEIEAAMADESPSLHFIFVEWPKWLSFTRVGLEAEYYCWQIAAYLKARTLHRQIGFDLAHHVTLCRYWMPSFLPLLGIPFVWGPVGGGESAPWQFWPGLGFRGTLFEAVREVARFAGEHDPLLRLVARRVALGVATTPETAERMRKLGVPRVEVCSQVALTHSEMATLECAASPAREGTRFISIARLVAWKGIHLGLEAFARTEHPANEYWIVGGGPAEPWLKALAIRLGVASRVRFLGELPRDEVLQIVQQCDVLVHPSLHESGGAVCAEMMAAGRPVICLDLGGPGLQVTSETGIKVPAGTPAQAIQDIGAAMDTLSRSPATRLAMGRAARARVHERFTTAARRAQVTRWYQDVTIERTGDAPAGTATASDAFSVRHLPPASRPSLKTPPTVSAVMPTYNKGPWLQQAIDSVLGQTFTDWELIIVDDGSTDDTADVLARCSDPRITIRVLAENMGRARARNVALELARGRYIAICDSDDISAPTRFEEHVAFLDAHPEISIVSAHMRLLTGKRIAQRIVFPLQHDSVARRFARGKMGVAHGASMIRAECFQQVGGYCQDLRYAEDFELFLRFCTRYRFETLPRDLLLYRSDWGAMPFPVWTAVARAHRYALYRSNYQDPSAPLLSFDEFVRSWRTKILLYSVDSLRFAHFNLRAHVFSSHVLR